MKLRLKAGFSDHGWYVGRDALPGPSKSWAILPYGPGTSTIDIHNQGRDSQECTTRKLIGFTWQEAAHRHFLAKGWESPWEGYE